MAQHHLGRSWRKPEVVAVQEAARDLEEEWAAAVWAAADPAVGQGRVRAAVQVVAQGGQVAALAHPAHEVQPALQEVQLAEGWEAVEVDQVEAPEAQANKAVAGTGHDLIRILSPTVGAFNRPCLEWQRKSVQGGTDYCDEQGPYLAGISRRAGSSSMTHGGSGRHFRQAGEHEDCGRRLLAQPGWIVWAHAGNECCAVNEKGGLDG
jgi:hypothetical protein